MFCSRSRTEGSESKRRNEEEVGWRDEGHGLVKVATVVVVGLQILPVAYINVICALGDRQELNNVIGVECSVELIYLI